MRDGTDDPKHFAYAAKQLLRKSVAEGEELRLLGIKAYNWVGEVRGKEKLEAKQLEQASRGLRPLVDFFDANSAVQQAVTRAAGEQVAAAVQGSSAALLCETESDAIPQIDEDDDDDAGLPHTANMPVPSSSSTTSARPMSKAASGSSTNTGQPAAKRRRVETDLEFSSSSSDNESQNLHATKRQQKGFIPPPPADANPGRTCADDSEVIDLCSQ